MDKLTRGATGKGPAERFTGDVHVDAIFSGTDPSRMTVAHVHFTPGARTNWHSHAVGQLLHGTDGVGLVVTRDQKTVTIRPGETVWIEPGDEHWHGACADNLMAHIASLESDGSGQDPTTWLEPVDEQEYQRANQAVRD
ncbi:cupin domain-containing protein [Luteococcus peritonei]|uniref:Cupin domain-containing protein n=1 Tax=Luteococcus peritonei TaxID=88874 RepID=A0ABW4RTU3_9ACTN